MVLVGPFKDIAKERSLGSAGVFEPATAVAMAVYLVGGISLMMAIKALVMSWDVPPAVDLSERKLHEAGSPAP